LEGCSQRVKEERMLQAFDWQTETCLPIECQIEKGIGMTAQRMCELGQSASPDSIASMQSQNMEIRL
jgi:hypothetical protein